MLIYIAGPYSAGYGRSVADNINSAREVAVSLWNQGHTVLCPHLNSAHLEHDVNFGLSDDAEALQHEQWIMHSIRLLSRCDALVLAPNWNESCGTNIERNFALSENIPIYEWTQDTPFVPLHPTEQARPIQVSEFIRALMRMYRVHLDKNYDYSPANILGTGEIGLITRLWDKMARLMNLVGFHIEIKSSAYNTPKQPKNESIEDSLLDLANYGVIGLLLRAGKWGV